MEVVLGVLEGKPASHIGSNCRNKVVFGLKCRGVSTLLLCHLTGHFAAVGRRWLQCCHFGHLLREILLDRLELISLEAVGPEVILALRARG